MRGKRVPIAVASGCLAVAFCISAVSLMAATTANISLTVQIAPPQTQDYTLTVQSTPVTGVAITVTPLDNDTLGNGNTDFTRLYDADTNVTLTAPAEAGGLSFKWWEDGGGTLIGEAHALAVTMDADKTALAVYDTVNECIVDNTDQLAYKAFEELEGVWDVIADPSAYDGDYASAETSDSSPTARARWRCSGLPAGQYNVYAWWVAGIDESASVPYTIKNGAAELEIVLADQTADGGQWNLLGTYNFSQGSHVVEIDNGLTHLTSNELFVCADAIKFERVTEWIIDNKDPGFSVMSGTWKTNSGGTDRWPIDDQASADYRYVRTTSESETARAQWACTTLPAGTYEVFGWWPDFSYSMGENISYEVHHSGGVTPVPVDQNVNGGQWVSLGTYTFAEGSHVVQLHNGQSTPGDYVVADAVKFVQTTPAATGSLQVTLAPQGAIDAEARWRVDGGAWQNSEAIVPDLSVGQHTVEYKEVAGWAAPASEPVQILEDQTATTTGTYTQVPTGSLRVTLAPQGAIDAEAQWRVDDGAWQNSGATVPGLNVGQHTVEYKDVANWTTPLSEVVAIQDGVTAEITGTYTQITECIIDNKDPGFSVMSGTWKTNSGGTDRWPIDDQASADYRYVRTTSESETARAQWACTTLPAGTYEVFGWWPDFSYSMGENISYEVHHSGGVTPVPVDQNVNGGQWVSLGTYTFAEGSHVVQLHNGQSTPGDYVVADAVKFAKLP